MESRILQLIAALRKSRVRVSLAESTEAFAAVDALGIQDREHFRISLRTTVIKDARDLPIFDRLFPLFFGAGRPPLTGGRVADQISTEDASLLERALQGLADQLRDQIRRAIEGEPLSAEEMEMLAATAGLSHGRDLRLQGVFARRMLQAMDLATLLAALGELLDQLSQLGMDPQVLDQVREIISQNLQGWREQVSQFAGQHLAEQMAELPAPDRADTLLDRPFESLSEADKQALQHEVRRLAAALRTRVALRQKQSRSGQLDPKATIRASLKFQGIPLELRFRDRVRKPRLVVICDVSTSMRFCAELMLSFLFALQGQVRKTYAFAFIDHLEVISNEFDGSQADEAVAAVLRRMPGGHFNTDLGSSLENFQDDYMDALNRQTTLIFLGDGRNNYNDPRVDLLTSMSRRAAQTIWLNPEAPRAWNGDSDMSLYAPLCSQVLKVGNVRELAAAVDEILGT